MFKDEILTSLSMLHSGHRPSMPVYFVPLEESDIEFEHAEMINPIIENLIEKISAFKEDEEIVDFFEKPKNKKKLASILYASQFNEAAFGVQYDCNAFSIEQPCRLLGAILEQGFYRGHLDNHNLAIKSHVKDIVTQQELLNVVNIFADHTKRKENPKFYQNIELGIFSDRDIGEEPTPLYLYPDHFLNDSKKVQNAATRVMKDLSSPRFYNKYESVEDYFDKSKIAIPLINTIINDSMGLNYDEKTVLEGIAEAYNFHDWDNGLKGYTFEFVDNSEEVLDKRDDQLDEAYRNIFLIDRLKEKLADDEPLFSGEKDIDYKNDPNYGYASSDMDDSEAHDDEGMMDEIVLMHLTSRFDINTLKEKMEDVKSNRPASNLYADHKNDSVLFQLFEDIETREDDVDLYEFVFTLNENITHLTTFDTDGSLTKMSENCIDTLEEIFKDLDKEYRSDLFVNSKRLYDDFRSFNTKTEGQNLNSGDQNKPDKNPPQP